MGIIRQTRYSANDKWTDLLFHNVESPAPTGPGSNAVNAIVLTLDSNDASSLNYNFNAGDTVWTTWTMNYEDNVLFYIFCNGLIATPTVISNYTMYQADGITTIDVSDGSISPISMGGGPDTEGREGNQVLFFELLTGELQYYLTIVVPVTGTYGFAVQGD